MSRSKRLRPIAELAAHREQEASKQMIDTRTRLDQQEKLLADLEDYHAEYTTANLVSADPVRLQDFRLFLGRLEQAIMRQHELIGRLRQEYAQCHSQWTDRRSDRKALDNVTGRYSRIEAHQVDAREQQQIEEVSALLRSRRPVAS